MYRPEGWKPLESESGYFWMPDGNHMPMVAANALYEAGADAMLRGLIREALLHTDKLNSKYEACQRGYLVFIPDEE